MTLLSRKECTALRALAISTIVLHNYCHLIPGIVKENEFAYKPERVEEFLSALMSPDAHLPLHLLSFFGHYGVPVFLFLSGYGLVKKYERPDTHVSIAAFTRHNFMKLFRLLAVGFAFFLAVACLSPQPLAVSWKNIVGVLTMTVNLRCLPTPGPYWYFGMTMQIYLCYRLFYRWRSWIVIAAAMLLCICLQMTAMHNIRLQFWLHDNFIGNLLSFCLGLLAARHVSPRLLPRPATAWTLFTAATTLTVGLGMTFVTWIFVPIAVVIAALMLIKAVPSRCINALQRVGQLSPFLFIAHPSARHIVIQTYTDNHLTGLMVYIILSLAFALVLQHFMSQSRPAPQEA